MAKKPYSFRLSEEVVEKARKHGEKENRDLTNLIETLLIQFINKFKNKK